MLPNICNIYNNRHLTFHLSLVKHDFAEQRLDYQLIKLLNTNESTTFTLKAQSLFFYGFKTFVKYYILNNYVDRCYDVHCLTCHYVKIVVIGVRDAQRHNSVSNTCIYLYIFLSLSFFRDLCGLDLRY